VIPAPDRRLGQHFLTDRNILKRIVDALEPEASDVVLEIGAGRGSLTAALAPRVGRVVAIEKDRRLAAALEREPVASNVTVVAGDALRLDWHALLEEARRSGPAPHALRASKIVGNIPYNLTSPLIEQALVPPYPERIVLLVQAEVADRLAAAPGTRAYGALSVGVQALARVERLVRVRAGAFTPRPKVESALVRLAPLAEPLIGARPGELRAFRAFVTRCFTRRRKQLKNVVMAATGRPSATVQDGLHALGLDPMTRPETLPPSAFVRLLRWSERL
jgi:16S rRNA (adenine1518-N6/adenine1519-N6)-dimethyltransferase